MFIILQTSIMSSIILHQYHSCQKQRGTNNVPCGTPIMVGSHSDGVPLRIMLCFLSDNHFAINTTIDSFVFIGFSFFFSIKRSRGAVCNRDKLHLVRRISIYIACQSSRYISEFIRYYLSYRKQCLHSFISLLISM